MAEYLRLLTIWDYSQLINHEHQLKGKKKPCVIETSSLAVFEASREIISSQFDELSFFKS